MSYYFGQICAAEAGRPIPSIWEGWLTQYRPDRLLSQQHGRYALECSPCLIQQGAFSLTGTFRIDNALKLSRELGLTNHTAPEQLILAAYQRWGIGCAARLRGDFSFAILDSQNMSLYVARDFIGVRPLYYHCDPSRFQFANDIELLVQRYGLKRTLNSRMMRTLIESPRFNHDRQTLLAPVAKLPRAHWLLWSPARTLQLECYWQPPQQSIGEAEVDTDVGPEMRRLLDQAVANRMAPYQKIGSHFSGGLDSSAITITAQRQASQPVTAFSWSPPYPGDWEYGVAELPKDERHLLRGLQQREGFELVLNRSTPEDAWEAACQDVSSTPMNTLQTEWWSSRESKRLGVETILSGWGGDELLAFNGRGYLAQLLQQGQFRRLAYECHCHSRIYGTSAWRVFWNQCLRPLLGQKLGSNRSLAMGSLKAQTFLRPEIWEQLQLLQPFPLIPYSDSVGTRPNQMMLLANEHLTARLESWAAHGLRRGLTYSFPLLDQEIVDFAFRLPSMCFFRHGWKRWLFREVTSDRLTPEIAWNKRKFDPSHFALMENLRREVLARYLERQGTQEHPFLDLGEVGRFRQASQQLSHEQRIGLIHGRGGALTLEHLHPDAHF